MLYKAMVATALMAAQPVEGIQKLRLQVHEADPVKAAKEAEEKACEGDKKDSDDCKKAKDETAKAEKAEKDAAAKKEAAEKALKDATAKAEKACEGDKKDSDECKNAKKAEADAQTALDALTTEPPKDPKKKDPKGDEGCWAKYGTMMMVGLAVAALGGVAYCMMSKGGDEEEPTRASRASQ